MYAVELGIESIVNGTAVLHEADTLGDGIRIMRVDHFTSPTPQRQLQWGRWWDGFSRAGGRRKCTTRCGAPWSRVTMWNGSFSA